MTKCDKTAHVDSFRLLRSDIRRDLCITHGIPNPVAGSILNHFDPANPEYLARVDAWQQALCNSYLLPEFEQKFDLELVGRPDHVRLVQQIAKLVYKWHGTPAKETDWDQVRERLSHTRPLQLKDDEIRGIRRCLSSIASPNLVELKGRFGPGATAEGYTAYEKWTGRGLTPDLPASFFRGCVRSPWMPTGINSFRMTKVAEVPKSIKSNRVVSSEPAMSMFAQLAINDWLVDELHAKYTRHVSLHDQEKHNRLLRLPHMSTLDLSDASDHCSAELVASVLPQLWPVLAKVRSEYAQLPGGEVIPLALHAPMGAGTCFSVMTAVIIGIIRYAFTSLHYRWDSEPWSVYGDDIIVPTWIVQYVADLLERAGFVVNEAKSCMGSDYVESCGCELYMSYDVTPVYLKDPFDVLDASKLEVIAQRWATFMPYTLRRLVNIAGAVKGYSINHETQEIELLVRTRSARSKVRHLDGYPGLNRWFCVGSQQETLTEKGKTFAKLPYVATEVWTKIAWRYRSSINFPYLWKEVCKDLPRRQRKR